MADSPTTQTGSDFGGQSGRGFGGPPPSGRKLQEIIPSVTRSPLGDNRFLVNKVSIDEQEIYGSAEVYSDSKVAIELGYLDERDKLALTVNRLDYPEIKFYKNFGNRTVSFNFKENQALIGELSANDVIRLKLISNRGSFFSGIISYSLIFKEETPEQEKARKANAAQKAAEEAQKGQGRGTAGLFADALINPVLGGIAGAVSRGLSSGQAAKQGKTQGVVASPGSKSSGSYTDDDIDIEEGNGRVTATSEEDFPADQDTSRRNTVSLSGAGTVFSGGTVTQPADAVISSGATVSAATGGEILSNGTVNISGQAAGVVQSGGTVSGAVQAGSGSVFKGSTSGGLNISAQAQSQSPSPSSSPAASQVQSKTAGQASLSAQGQTPVAEGGKQPGGAEARVKSGGQPGTSVSQAGSQTGKAKAEVSLETKGKVTAQTQSSGGPQGRVAGPASSQSQPKIAGQASLSAQGQTPVAEGGKQPGGAEARVKSGEEATGTVGYSGGQSPTQVLTAQPKPLAPVPAKIQAPVALSDALEQKSALTAVKAKQQAELARAGTAGLGIPLPRLQGTNALSGAPMPASLGGSALSGTIDKFKKNEAALQHNLGAAGTAGGTSGLVGPRPGQTIDSAAGPGNSGADSDQEVGPIGNRQEPALPNRDSSLDQANLGVPKGQDSPGRAPKDKPGDAGHEQAGGPQLRGEDTKTKNPGLQDQDIEDQQQQTGLQQNLEPQSPNGTIKEADLSLKIKELTKEASMLMNGFLMTQAVAVWTSAIPSFGLSILIGAILGDFIWLIKNALIRRALNPLLKTEELKKKADEISKRIKISAKVKVNILAMNLIVLLVPALFIFIFLVVGCNYGAPIKTPVGNSYRLTVLGLFIGDDCKYFDISNLQAALSATAGSTPVNTSATTASQQNTAVTPRSP